jgi:hypothetical protein
MYFHKRFIPFVACFSYDVLMSDPTKDAVKNMTKSFAEMAAGKVVGAANALNPITMVMNVVKGFLKMIPFGLGDLLTKGIDTLLEKSGVNGAMGAVGDGVKNAAVSLLTPLMSLLEPILKPVFEWIESAKAKGMAAIAGMMPDSVKNAVMGADAPKVATAGTVTPVTTPAPAPTTTVNNVSAGQNVTPAPTPTAAKPTTQPAAQKA